MKQRMIAAGLIVALGGTACERKPRQAASAAAATKLLTVAGFKTPESVKYDADLNDIAVGPDGALYVTDTGILIDSAGTITHPGPDRIFRVGSKREVSVAAEGDTLDRPNGTRSRTAC